MSTYRTQLLTPPSEEEELSPYRRPWPSVTALGGIVFAVAIAIFFLVRVFGLDIPSSFTAPLNVLLCLFPVGVWLVFAYLPERAVAQPREHLFTVALLTALAANAVGIPIIQELFQPERWLSLGTALTRIVGYTLTIGITQEILKYLVIYYVTWRTLFRARQDAVAYALASAVGYTVVSSLHFAFDTNALPDMVAAHVFDTLALNISGSLIVGYGLAETRFGQPTPFMPALMISLGAFVTGAAIPLRSGLINASFSLSGAFPTLILGLGFSAFVLLTIGLIMAFLYRSAEQRAAEAEAARER